MTLDLTLFPRLPLRVRGRDQIHFTLGYDLRLPDGPLLPGDDPLLGAFAAWVVEVRDGDGLEHEAFRPGRPVELLEEPVDDDGDAAIAVWDAERLRRAGAVPYGVAVQIAAGNEYGRSFSGLILREVRRTSDDRRERIHVLLHDPALLRVAEPFPELTAPPPRTRPPRIFLLAGETEGLCFWDGDEKAGPLSPEELPVSPGLRNELDRLSREHALLGDDEEDEEFDWGFREEAIRSRTRAAWRRARAELRPRYSVGLLEPGMPRPIWTEAEETDEEPF